MATKHTDTCLQKAGDDEPIFVLRATDKLAPTVVKVWASLAALHECPMHKLLEAHHLIDTMRDWQREHGAKWPD